ncbi:Scr1 family TA system antitoxin-like transcriptional regulator [Streptomyces sp. NPDC056670]|uniref:Scr1 family TA system antitoxin-like transcriptional regulator n=1 Tax=Streptomyces sp. NPDC056670 TaxID=3345904 RepID=UPI00367B8A99
MSEGADQGGDPTNAATYFGEEVKALRDSLRLSQDDFAADLHYNQGEVSKVEKGAKLASEAFAAAMDRVAKTPGVYTRLRNRLAKQGHPDWFVPYITLEESATGVTDYSCTFLMGLLQTPEYAAAVVRASFPRESDDQIKKRVELRMQRHGVLERDTPPALWVIIHEAVLRTVVGDRAVIVGQLERLTVLGQSPNVTLQALPFEAGAAPSHLPFTLLSLDEKPHAVYTETPTHGGQTDDTPAVVAAAVQKFDRLRMAALSEEKSLDLIRKIMEDHAR